MMEKLFDEQPIILFFVICISSFIFWYEEINELIFSLFRFQFKKNNSLVEIPKGEIISALLVWVALSIFIFFADNPEIKYRIRQEKFEKFYHRNYDRPRLMSLTLGDENRLNLLIRKEFGYNISDTMTVGKLDTAKVRITLKQLERLFEIRSNIELLVKDTLHNNKRILQSARMKVELADPLQDFFFIKQLSSGTQYIDSTITGEWFWYVRPLANGIYPLNLKITRLGAGETDSQDILVYDPKISVESNFWYELKDFFKRYWQYIISVFLIPLISLVFNLFKKTLDEKKEKKQKSLDEKPRSVIGFKNDKIDTNKNKPEDSSK